jgi:hypothetical protein
MIPEDDLFDVHLTLEDCSIERVRHLGQKLRPLVNDTNWRSIVVSVLAALDQSPDLSESERMDRVVAFTMALGMEPSEVLWVLKEWDAASG